MYQNGDFFSLFDKIFIFGIFLPAMVLILGFFLYQMIHQTPKVSTSPPGDCPAAHQTQSIYQSQSADQPEGKKDSTSRPSDDPCCQLTSI